MQIRRNETLFKSPKLSWVVENPIFFMALIHLELSPDTLKFHDANAGTKQY